MNINIDSYKNLGLLFRSIGIYPSDYAPREGAVLDIGDSYNARIYVHSDEEHMVWAGLGDIGRAFERLDATVQRQINRHARHAEEKLRVKTPVEIRNEMRDYLASLPADVQD